MLYCAGRMHLIMWAILLCERAVRFGVGPCEMSPLLVRSSLSLLRVRWVARSRGACVFVRRVELLILPLCFFLYSSFISSEGVPSFISKKTLSAQRGVFDPLRVFDPSTSAFRVLGCVVRGRRHINI